MFVPQNVWSQAALWLGWKSLFVVPRITKCAVVGVYTYELNIPRRRGGRMR